MACRTRPELLAVLADAFAEREFAAWYSRPLLVLASLRYLALGDPDHPLAMEVLGDGEAPELPARLAEALLDPRLPELLRTRSVQTNASERAIGWGIVAMALGAPGGGFALVDLGCSGGLNLVADLVPTTWRVGREQVSGLDFPSPGRRLGMDLEPVDVRSPDAVRWLRACVWPGDADRRQRLEASLEAFTRRLPPERAPELRVHRLGRDDTAGALGELGRESGLPVLAFQSVVRDYLPPADAAAHEQAMRRWAGGAAGRLWLTLEPTPDPTPGRAQGGGPMALELHFRDGDSVRSEPIARTDYHPRACHLGPGALDLLRSVGHAQLGWGAR
ncbi:MAG: DUF2332 family protein [Deltaproteobacteria bacterium]|nr:DUF2332 family protein [Deltaproteobacteria bacterium]MCB9787409.1 DUF2332 family protein [Deltaproteobacteria bacterium]